MILNILFIIALTFPVAAASTAFGINYEQFAINNSQFEKKWFYAFVVALGQGVMYSLGDLLGGTFMHLVSKYSQWIVLSLCFAIFYRMLINTLKIKNGSNLFFVESKKHLLLLSVALGINAFIAGLMADFMPLFQDRTPYIIMAAAFVWSVVAMLIPFTKMKLTFNSLLNLIFAFAILVKGFLFLV